MCSADGEGAESEAGLDDCIDVGVFGEARKPGGRREETVLFLQRVHMTQPAAVFHLTVGAKPTQVGIDPYNKLVDRNSDDNRKEPTEIAARPATYRRPTRM